MDQIFPFFVGHRTQIITVLIAAIQALSWVGVISSEEATKATEVLSPLAVATLAEKIQRGITTPTPVIVEPTPAAPPASPPPTA